MAALSEVWSGLRLAPLPKPTDQFKKDKILQAVVIELPQDRTDKLLKLIKAGDGFEAAARLSDTGPVIDFTNKSSNSKSTIKDEFSGKAFEKSFKLSENGYIYTAGEASGQAVLRSRLELKRRPAKKVDDEEDAGLLALQRGLNNAKAEKQSHRTTLAEVRPNSKRKGASLMMASLTGGTNNPKAHRVGLFGSNKPLPRSLNTSPSLAPQHLGASSRPGKDSKKDAAKKRAIVHLLAVRAVSVSYISKTIGANPKEVELILSRVASPLRLDTSKYELNDLAYKLLDPYGFDYSEDDRSCAVERAISAFDRKRFASDNKAWQMLLPKEQRNKGKCLSKLSNLLAVDSQPQVPRSLEGARTTPVPEINVSEAGSPARAANGKQSDAPDSQHKRTSSDAANDDSPDRAVKRSKKGPDSHDKKLSAMFNQTQKEKERAKERAKAEKEAQGVGKKRETKAPASSQSSSARTGKTTASSRSGAAASTAPSSGKIKSTEWVTQSDDEEAEAAVQKGKERLEAKLNKPAAKSAGKTVTKTAPATSTGTTSGTKTAIKATAETIDKTAKKSATSTATATSSSNAVQKPAKPSAWDFTKKAAPHASASGSSLSSSTANGRARASSSARSASGSLPPTPSTLNLHRRQVSDTRKAGAPPAAARSTTRPLAQPSSAGGSAAQASASGRTAVKPASARPNFIRPLDSAKRKPGVDPKTNRPSNANAGTGANTERSSLPSKPTRGELAAAGRNTPTISKATGTNTPARASDVASAPPMHRTFSHQRKSSSPLKQSPLATSPPINFSDMNDTTARPNRTATVAAKSLPRKPPSALDARGSSQPLKRKADDLEEKHGQARPSTMSSGPERPVKRRELGTAVPSSTGATGSRATTTATRPGDAGAPKPRRRSQEEGNRSHSPSPASSTIGSTSTKDTAISLLGNTSKDKTAAVSKPPVAQSTSAGKGETTFKGMKTSELERLSRFEEQREHYNRKQREVAGMENPPIEKVRELNKLFDSLQTQKKVLAALEHTH